MNWLIDEGVDSLHGLQYFHLCMDLIEWVLIKNA